MMKFASFETIVEMMYNYLPGQKQDYGKGSQTAVAFTGGYLAGILCAIVSHPADVMVSKLNANRQPGEAFGSAMSRIYKDIGFMGLWNGLAVRIVMIGTLVSRSSIHPLHIILTLISQTGLQWMMYIFLLPYLLTTNMYQLRLIQDLHGSAHNRRTIPGTEEDLKDRIGLGQIVASWLLLINWKFIINVILCIALGLMFHPYHHPLYLTMYIYIYTR